MAKSKDAKKAVKKEPLLSAKEKKQQNALKKLIVLRLWILNWPY